MLPLYGTGDGAVRRLLQLVHGLSDGSVTLDGLARYAFVTARTGTYLAENSYWDGAQWLRYDTSAPALALALTGAGPLVVLTAGAGANPIAWTSTPLDAAKLAALPAITSIASPLTLAAGALDIQQASASLEGSMSAADYAALQLLANPPRARVTRATAQAIASAAGTKVSFSAADYDTGGALGGGVWNGTDAFTCPRTGFYLFGAYGTFAAATAGVARRVGWVQLGSGQYVAASEIPAVANVFPTPGVAGAARWTVGDTASFYVYQESGAALNLNSAAAWVHYLAG